MDKKYIQSEHGESRPYENFSYTTVANELKRILDEKKVRAVVSVDTNPFGHYY